MDTDGDADSGDDDDDNSAAAKAMGPRTLIDLSPFQQLELQEKKEDNSPRLLHHKCFLWRFCMNEPVQVKQEVCIKLSHRD